MMKKTAALIPVSVGQSVFVLIYIVGSVDVFHNLFLYYDSN